MKGIIYKYTFSDGKVYIGQTRRAPSIRHTEHFDEKVGPLNKAFWEAYKRLGEPKYEVLMEVENADKVVLIQTLNQLENEAIEKYQSANPQYGYNRMTHATVSSGVREKLQSIYNEICNTLIEERKNLYNIVLEKRKMGVPLLREEDAFFQKYFVQNVYFEKGLIKTNSFLYEHWLDMAWFMIETDAKDYAEEYVHENRTELLNDYVDDDTILQIDENNEIIGKFFTQADAADAMGVKSSANINNVLRGKQKKAYGYRWIYAKNIMAL